MLVGKRFGRNQRRRAREVAQELGNMRVAYGMSEGLCRHQGQKIRDLEDAIERFARALGPNFVGLPLRELDMRAHRLGPRGDFLAAELGGKAIPCSLMQVDASENNIRNQVHFSVRLADAEVRYAASIQALQHAPSKDMAWRLASEMAPFLLTEIRKARSSHD